MKLLRLCVFACVMGLAVSVAGCGGEPPNSDVETNSSALTSAQIWQGNLGLFNGYSYSCAGLTWNVRQYVRQNVAQPWPFGRPLSTSLTTDAPQYSSSSNPDINEVQIICSSVMADAGTYLYSTATQSCQMYGHPAHSGWQWSGTVTLSAGNLRYAPNTTPGFPNGYWDIQMTIPTNLSQIGTGYGLTCLGALGSTAEIYAF